MPEARNESQMHNLRRTRHSLIFASVLLSLAGFCLCLNSTGRPARLYEVLCIASFVIFVNLWSPFGKRNVYEQTAAKLGVNSIEIDSGGLRMNWSTWSKFIPLDEITRVEEPPNGRGMFVRTSNRFLWYLIPRRTDRYEEIRSELAAIGIPIVQTRAPRNWGILFALLFCLSILCNVLTQDRRILAVNFAFALILGAAGLMLTNFIGDRRLRLKSVFGSFLPAAISAASLIFPFGIK